MGAGHRLSERNPATGQAAPFRKRERARRKPETTVARVTVVIVNFCQWRNTADLVEQLRQSDSYRDGRADIVIVDNHSPDDPLADELDASDGVTVRKFRHNLGFARAVNEGCRLARGSWVLLLNPDMRVEAGFLDNLEIEIKRLEREEPRVGVAGFKLRHGDGTRQASSGPFPTFLGTMTGLFLPRARRKCKLNPARKPTGVAWVTGCCLLARHDCINQLKGFDEDYFLYYEDVDFCLRAKESGWKVQYNPRLEVTHYHPLHQRSVPAPLRLMTRHALLTFGWKHWPRWQALMLAGVVWLEARWRNRREGDEPANDELREMVRSVVRDDRLATGELIRRNARRLENLAARGQLG